MWGKGILVKKKWYAEHASYIMYLLKPNDAQCTLEHNSYTLLYTRERQHRAYSVTGLTKPLAVVMDNFGKEGPHSVTKAMLNFLPQKCHMQLIL